MRKDTKEKWDMHIKNPERLNERDHFGDLGVNGIIL
jgi:hypothetical protein